MLFQNSMSYFYIISYNAHHWLPVSHVYEVLASVSKRSLAKDALSLPSTQVSRPDACPPGDEMQWAGYNTIRFGNQGQIECWRISMTVMMCPTCFETPDAHCKHHCLQDWHARKKATGVFRFLWQASMAMHWWKQLPFERGHSALENGVASMYRIPWLIYLPITQGFIKMLYRIEYVASYTVDRTLAERHSEWWDAFRILIHYLVSASFIHHSNPPFAPLSRWIAHHWSPQQSWSESTVVLNYEIREARSAWAWNILQLEVPPKKCCEVDVCDDYMNPQHSYMPFFKCILRAG